VAAVTVEQVSVNAQAIRNLAGHLERMGYTGSSIAEAEHIALNLLADGYQRIEPVPPVRPDSIADPNGPGHTEFARARAELANRKKETH
jgi:hypothetical protein